MNGIIKYFINRVVKDNRGFLSTLVSAGAALLPSLLGGGDNKSTTTSYDYQKLPDYEESDYARKKWWETLQSWGPENNYGAISPNWADIWTQANNRVKDYFQGTATSIGANDRIKASAARRGVSDSPALENQLLKSNIEQGNILANMATDQATKEAEFGETARLNWLNSLMGLTSQKPQYANMSTTETDTSTSGLGSFLSPIMSTVGGNASNALSEYLKSKGKNWLSW